MDKYLLIVNKQKHFNDNLLSDFKMMPYIDEDGESFIEEQTLSSLNSLKKHMETKFGLTIEAFSVGRTVQRQQEVSKQIYKEKFNQFLKDGLSEEESKIKAQQYVDSYVAVPGQSEHHTGLAFDIKVHKVLPEMIQKIADKNNKIKKAIEKLERQSGKTDEMFNNVYKEMTEFGFILRYPKGKENETGYNHERWHLRYVGKEHAKAIQASGMCLEEYVKALESGKGVASINESQPGDE